MSSKTKVRSALLKMLTDSAILPVGKVAFENVAFTPPSAQPWFSVFYIPSEPQVATLGAGGEDRVEGFLQIDLNYPTGTGEAALNAKYDELQSCFTAGARALYQGQEVVIVSCGRSGGRNVDSCFRVSVTVRFYANVNR